MDRRRRARRLRARTAAAGRPAARAAEPDRHSARRLLLRAVARRPRSPRRRERGGGAGRAAAGRDREPGRPCVRALAASVKPFEGRTALVTGAGRGIGRATAVLLAAGGARVLGVSRTVGELESLADEA